MKIIKEIMMPGLKMLLVWTVICGVMYTLLLTGIGQLFFPSQANGSLVSAKSETGEKVVGSTLIGQAFTANYYLWGRPDTGEAASQLAPNSAKEKARVAERVAKIKAADPDNKAAIPMELVTASASGVDPDISTATAAYQVKRIAEARHLSVAKVEKIIQNNTSGVKFDKMGTKLVHVLPVNLALDQLAPMK